MSWRPPGSPPFTLHKTCTDRRPAAMRRATPAESAHRRHRAATCCTTSAFLGALAHHRIVPECVTTRRAGVTYFGAHPARRLMMCRVTGQEVGARGADLRAVEHQRDVHGIRVLAALVQTVMHGVRAGLVAGRTGVDAGLHVMRVGVTGRLGHGWTPQEVDGELVGRR